MASVSLALNIMNAQWIQQNSGTTNALTDVVMLDSTTAIAIGENNIILKTTNSGAVWTQIGVPIEIFINWNAISFFDTQNGIAAGDYILATTTNGGESWDFHTRPGKGKCLSTLQIGSANMYVGDDSGRVYHSLDTGKTWTSENISTSPILSLFAWRGVYVMGLPIYALTPYSLFSKMEYPPGSWKETFLPFHGLGSEAYNGEFCNGGGAGFIVGVQGDFVSAPTIVRKSVSDTVWRILSTGIPVDGILLGVSAPSEKVIYVCGINGMMYKSTDGGDAWSLSPVPTKRTISSVYFYNEKKGFAVGDSGLILFTHDDNTGIKDLESSFPLKLTLQQNYPNPFNPNTTIEFILPQASNVSLKIFDVLGQEIATILDDHLAVGTHSVRWNAQAFTSGIYFYRLQAENTSLIKKMILIK
jgi:photosystem II stability/assembly factor-like uncharacterized protein